MRLKLFVVAAAMLSASLAARADDLFTIDNFSFTLPTSPVPSTFSANAFYINDVTVTQGSNTYVEEVGFGDFSGQYTFGLAESDLTLGGADEASFNPGTDPFVIIADTGTLFSGATADPVLLTGSFSGASANSFGSDSATLFVTSLSPTPEPSSLLLLGTGLLGAVGMLRKRFA